MRAFKRFAARWGQWTLPALFLTSCGVSDLSANFQDSARKQAALNSGTLDLMDRSPAIAAADMSLIASSGNYAVFDRIPRISLAFSGLSDFRSNVQNDDLTVYDSYSSQQIPTFFEWAGEFVTWKDNSDYKVLFTYYHAQKAIEYVDYLFDEALIPGAYIHFWRRQDSDNPTPPNGIDRDEILPALPLTVYADETMDPEGNTLGAESTHFCPSFNVNFRSNGDDVCLDNTNDDFDDLKLEDGAIKRVMTFFRHQESPVPYFNPADDADTIYHEMGHVAQLVMNGRALENPVGRNGQVDAILEGSADFFAGAILRDDELFRYSLANFKAAFPSSFAGGAVNNQRDLRHSMIFPNAFVGYSDDTEALHVGNSHMSGRVVAGALYDLKQLYDGETPTSVDEWCDEDEYSDLNICDQGSFTAIDANGINSWDVVVGILFRALASDATDADPFNVDYSTMHHFAKKLHEACTEATDLDCPADDLLDILKIRGLYSMKDLYPDEIPDSGTADAPYDSEPERVYTVGPTEAGETNPSDFGIYLGGSNAALGRVDYAPDYSGAPADGYWSNGDTKVDPCEVMVIFPNLLNQTHVAEMKAKTTTDDANQWDPELYGADIFDIKVELVDIEAFDPFEVDGTTIENVANPGYVDKRIIPWLKPGQSTGKMTLTDKEGTNREAESIFTDEDSAVFQVYQDFRVSKAISKMRATASRNDFPSNIGWILRAPSALNDEASATFRIRYKVYNQNYQHETAAPLPGISEQEAEFTQILTVDGTESFCDR